MNATDAAAWWGAVVGTLVLLWDVYKWRKAGALIMVRACPNMQQLNQLEGRLEADRFIFVEAVNRGDRPATITHLVGYHYKTLLRRVVRKSDNQFLVGNTSLGPALPHILQPGARWTGGISQEDLTKKIGSNGYLYCGINHTSANKPVLVKVKLKDLKVT